MIQIVTADGRAEQQVISAMRARQAQANAAIEAAVAEIFNTVKENGFSAVRDYSLCFDHAEPREIRREELDAAYAACPGALIAALLDMPLRKSIPSIFLGVVTAGLIMTFVTGGVVAIFAS